MNGKTKGYVCSKALKILYGARKVLPSIKRLHFTLLHFFSSHSFFVAFLDRKISLLGKIHKFLSCIKKRFRILILFSFIYSENISGLNLWKMYYRTNIKIGYFVKIFMCLYKRNIFSVNLFSQFTPIPFDKFAGKTNKILL